MLKIGIVQDLDGKLHFIHEDVCGTFPCSISADRTTEKAKLGVPEVADRPGVVGAWI